MCTRDFCLLASPSQDIYPSLDELGELQEAGLGCRKIVFPSKSGDFNHLQETVEKEFTKLKTQNGVFESMFFYVYKTSLHFRQTGRPNVNEVQLLEYIKVAYK